MKKWTISTGLLFGLFGHFAHAGVVLNNDLFETHFVDDSPEIISLFELRSMAEQGDAARQLELGQRYLHGDHAIQDYFEAADWFRKAAEQGTPGAAYRLGEMYDEGLGVAEDDSVAVTWYKAAAKFGTPGAAYRLGEMYDEGLGVVEDLGGAIAWYEMAAAWGSFDAAYRLGVMYDEGLGVDEDDGEALTWYKKAAEQGTPGAAYRLGEMYDEGLGVAEDDGEAIVWYKKAAEWDHAKAAYRLGVMYDEGLGVAEDDGEAVTWYEMALVDGNGHTDAIARIREIAENGSADVQHTLSNYYYYGTVVQQDLPESFVWTLKAARQGHLIAQFDAGFMYDEGQGVAENDGEAIEWYRKAAEQGHDSAKVRLGRLSLELDGEIADLAEIYVWLQFIAERDEDENAAGIAESLLGRIDQTERAKTLISLGSEFADLGLLGQAYKWFSLVAVSYNHEKAGSLAEYVHERMAQDELIQAYAALGSIYETGKQQGVPADHGRAVEWYRMAAESGDRDSQYRLGLLYNKGNGVIADPVLAYAWLNLAAAQGGLSIQEARDEVLARMTRDQVNEGQALSREFEAEISSWQSR